MKITRGTTYYYFLIVTHAYDDTAAFVYTSVSHSPAAE